jgi:hypothetical protein
VQGIRINWRKLHKAVARVETLYEPCMHCITHTASNEIWQLRHIGTKLHLDSTICGDGILIRLHKKNRTACLMMPSTSRLGNWSRGGGHSSGWEGAHTGPMPMLGRR